MSKKRRRVETRGRHRETEQAKVETCRVHGRDVATNCFQCFPKLFVRGRGSRMSIIWRYRRVFRFVVFARLDLTTRWNACTLWMTPSPYLMSIGRTQRNFFHNTANVKTPHPAQMQIKNEDPTDVQPWGPFLPPPHQLCKNTRHDPKNHACRWRVDWFWMWRPYSSIHPLVCVPVVLPIAATLVTPTVVINVRPYFPFLCAHDMFFLHALSPFTLPLLLPKNLS